MIEAFFPTVEERSRSTDQGGISQRRTAGDARSAHGYASDRDSAATGLHRILQLAHGILPAGRPALERLRLRRHPIVGRRKPRTMCRPVLLTLLGGRERLATRQRAMSSNALGCLDLGAFSFSRLECAALTRRFADRRLLLRFQWIGRYLRIGTGEPAAPDPARDIRDKCIAASSPL